ncbi:hypothetical protein ACTMU2_26795 [Cupriavidus basilensis]
MLACLHRNGFPVPAAVLDRDFSLPYVPSKAVEQVWRDVYADQNDNLGLQQLGETLADIAEGFSASEAPAPDGDAPDLWRAARLLRHRRRRLAAPDHG